MRAIVYDCEILKAVPSQFSYCEKGIKYCSGWSDHARMGISTMAVYDYVDDCYHVFCEDNKDDFATLCSNRDLFVGFNSIPFDNALIAATEGWQLPPEGKCYDLLREVWAACGLGPKFEKKTHGGFGLAALCEANFGKSKTGNGAIAPVEWQRGKIGNVINYCLNDVWLTKRLFDAAIAGSPLINPKDKTELILRRPE